MNKKKRKTILIIEVLILIIAAAITLFLVFGRGKKQSDDGSDSSMSESQAAIDYPLELGQDLCITKIGNYAGIYMEDGSNEVVKDVMMIILENQSENDLQYAEITLQFEELAAKFTVSNLPAGKSAVLLETARLEWTEEEPMSTGMEYVVFFEKPMSLMEDKIKITGQKQNMIIENISEEDISNPMYIYYKNIGGDIFYGGITYRVQIAEGIGSGESVQVMTEHYDPETSMIVDVVEVK